MGAPSPKRITVPTTTILTGFGLAASVSCTKDYSIQSGGVKIAVAIAKSDNTFFPALANLSYTNMTFSWGARPTSSASASVNCPATGTQLYAAAGLLTSTLKVKFASNGTILSVIPPATSTNAAGTATSTYNFGKTVSCTKP